MSTAAAAGSDPTPASTELAGEDEPRGWGDSADGNEDRLRADKPPHWG